MINYCTEYSRTLLLFVCTMGRREYKSNFCFVREKMIHVHPFISTCLCTYTAKTLLHLGISAPLWKCLYISLFELFLDVNLTHTTRFNSSSRIFSLCWSLFKSSAFLFSSLKLYSIKKNFFSAYKMAENYILFPSNHSTLSLLLSHLFHIKALFHYHSYLVIWSSSTYSLTCGTSKYHCIRGTTQGWQNCCIS